MERRVSTTLSVWVWTTIPSVAVMLQLIWGRGILSTSTMHSRHCPAMLRPG
jgi:hypothetical protein